jgi:hypothetical protein
MKATSILAILASLAAFAKALPATDLWGCDADTATKCTASFNDCVHVRAQCKVSKIIMIDAFVEPAM